MSLKWQGFPDAYPDVKSHYNQYRLFVVTNTFYTCSYIEMQIVWLMLWIIFIKLNNVVCELSTMTLKGLNQVTAWRLERAEEVVGLLHPRASDKEIHLY